MIRRLLILLIIISFVISCQKDGSGENPFDTIINNQDTVGLTIINAEPNSFAGIYQNVFKPTCANVGCHDGNFEPDFRTLESSYNTLVYQKPIKNDGTYEYRVKPSDADGSVLIARMENIIGPQMPFTLEPDSDWPEKGDEYIQNIKTWISNGAKDLAGNTPTELYPAPELLGAGAIFDSNWLDRDGGTGTILVPNSANALELYFSFSHEFLDSDELTFNKISFSPNPNDFESSEQMDMQILQSPITRPGFFGGDVLYTHSITINPNTDLDPDEDLWYFRVYVKDDENPTTEIPTDNGIFYIKTYMSFEKTN